MTADFRFKLSGISAEPGTNGVRGATALEGPHKGRVWCAASYTAHGSGSGTAQPDGLPSSTQAHARMSSAISARRLDVGQGRNPTRLEHFPGFIRWKDAKNRPTGFQVPEDLAAAQLVALIAVDAEQQERMRLDAATAATSRDGTGPMVSTISDRPRAAAARATFVHALADEERHADLPLIRKRRLKVRQRVEQRRRTGMGRPFPCREACSDPLASTSNGSTSPSYPLGMM